MPSFDNLAVLGTLTADTMQPTNIAADGTNGYKYATNSPWRYARVHQSECLSTGVNGATVSSTQAILLGLNGFPAHVATAGATEYGLFIASFRVPVGAFLSTVFFQVQSEASATESGRLDCYFYRMSAAGNTQINAVAYAHNGAVATWYGVGLSFTDARTRVDPAAAGDLENYIVRLEIQHDTVLGGSQTHKFFGFALKYRIPATAQLEEKS